MSTVAMRDTLTTKPPPSPRVNKENILIYENGILYPHHQKVFKPNLMINRALGLKIPGQSKVPPPEARVKIEI